MTRPALFFGGVAALFGLLAPPARAGELSLRAAFDQAATRNLRIQMARFAEAAAQAGVSVSQGPFAVMLASDLELAARAADGVNQGGVFRYQLGLSKLFFTGTTVSLTTAGSQVWSRPTTTQTQIDQIPLPAQNDPFYMHDLGYGGLAFTVEQAFLRGGFGANEAPVSAAQARLSAAQVALEAGISAELRDVEIEYWRWAAAVRAVEIRRASLALARVQRERTDEMIRKGRQANVDALLAEQIVAEREDMLAVAESEAATRYESLHALMGHTHDEIPRPPETPQEFPELVPETESAEALLRLADKRSFLLRQLRLEQDGVAYELEYADNAAWPELSARARIELYGTEANFASAYGDAFTSGRQVFSGTLHLAYPLGYNPAVGEAERLEATLGRQKKAVEDAQRMTQLAVANARRQSDLAFNRIALAELAKRLADEKLRAEEERYGLGRTTMQNVRLFQEDLDEASLRELQAHVSFLAAKADLDHLLGRYLSERRLAVK